MTVFRNKKTRKEEKVRDVLHIFEVVGCDICKSRDYKGKVVFGVHPLKLKEIYSLCIEDSFYLCGYCFEKWKHLIVRMLDGCPVSSSPKFEIDKGCWITFIDKKRDNIERFQTDYSCFKKVYQAFNGRHHGILKEDRG